MITRSALFLLLVGITLFGAVILATTATIGSIPTLTNYLFRGPVLFKTLIWLLVVAGASTTIAWVGEPKYFRTFRARWLALSIIWFPFVLFVWARIANDHR
jgi:hypothetical protein